MTNTSNPLATDTEGIAIGRYLLHRQIARGGMATIHIARLLGDEGFSRIVAAKRLLPEFAEDSDFVTMFLDEARVASKVHHRNVVPVLDVVTAGTEVILVQEYVHGAPLHKLLGIANKSKTAVPANIAVSIACQVLAGLQAAHETADEIGMPLNIVHRDVSPQNIMVSVDGMARLLDFGVAKATMAAHVTRENAFKGKLAYSAPEQLQGMATAQSDVYSLAVVLWEMIVGHRMHDKAQAELEIVGKIVSGSLPTITTALDEEREFMAKDRWAAIELLEPIVKRGLSVAVHERWASAAAMEQALTTAITPASVTEVAAWLKTLGKELLDKSDKLLAVEEASWRRSAAPSGRLTPLPGELRVSAIRAAAKPPSEVGPDDEMTTISATGLSQPERSRKGLIIAVAALGALVLVMGIVFATNRSTGAHEPKVPPIDRPPVSAPMTPVPPVTVTQPAIVPSTPPGAVTAPGTAATPPTPPTTSVITTPEVASPVTPPAVTHPPVTPPITRKLAATPRPPAVMRPPVTPVTHPPPTPEVVTPTTTTTQTTQTPQTTPTPASPPANPCSPPYYFEGTKKVFKPNCL